MEPESLMAASLLPAMQIGSDLTFDQPLCPEFKSNLDTVQDIYSTWYSDLTRIEVQSPQPEGQSIQSKGRTASFFTGGVDSFYTLLKHKEEIDAIIYVHGFDVPLAEANLRNKVSSMLQDVGAHLRKEVVQLETNLRELSDEYVGWERYHGAALAMAALTLQESFDKVIIPSSLPYDQLRPWGSSPLLDPLWSTRQTSLVHHGCESNRLQKCGVIGESDVALSMLRVCWENRNGAYNCGQCEKCLRTMVQLLAAGVLDRTPTFAVPIDPLRIARLSAVHERSYRYLPSVNKLEDEGRAPEICRAIRRAAKGPSSWDRTSSTLYERGRRLWHRVRGAWVASGFSD